mmetsp:Transcript_7594/g.10909  ORF Transcript_7594/g.10909 Transcript_7594/m.10909 type:complete len:125 (-) Transcript_7594:97-471(-)
MFKSVLVLALAASASAFAPATFGVRTTALNQAENYGEYDDKLWDFEAKKTAYAKWDKDAPRTPNNFNPFESDKNGNSPDTSGHFPGGSWYKDPMRGDVNYASMQVERAWLEENQPFPSGCTGCL